MAGKAEKEVGSERQWKTIDYYQPKIREIKLAEWPGSEKQIGVLKLNCDELQKARFAAIEHFQKQNIELTLFTSQALEAEEMLQQCAMFLIDPDAKNPSYRIFRGADEARKRLTDDDRFNLIRLYNVLYNGAK